MPTTHIPKYPVVDPEPSLKRTIANYNFNDICTIFAFTAAGYTTAFFGARKPLRGPNVRFLAGIGFMAGSFYAMQNSMHRLMGLEPNPREVELYGAMSPADLQRTVAKANIPNNELIDSSK